MLAKKIEKIPKNLEKERKKFIEKGGEKVSEKKRGWMFINLRLKEEMAHKIDEILENDRIGLSRTAWILEAIQEKFKRLDRENSDE